jgi:hypothetical protein
MKKPAKDPIREDRIHEEAIVDAYGSEEKGDELVLLPRREAEFPVSGSLHRQPSGIVRIPGHVNNDSGRM